MGGASRADNADGVTIAVQESLTVDQVAHTFTVYPSLTGSIAEAARQLHLRD